MSCMCDKNEGYMCFYCEEFLKDAVKDLIHTHKNDILETCDWWWSINDEYDINVFCPDDEPFEPDAVFSINLYKLDQPDGTSSYDSSSQYDLDPMTRKEIRLL
jgi:hypothetical protein